MNKKQEYVGVVPTVSNKVKAAGVALVTALVPVVSFAQATSAVDQVKAAISEGQTNGIQIATAVVIAGWAISAIYMMARRG